MHPPFSRPAAMGLLARATPEHLSALFPDMPDHDLLRGPEGGTVMVRGRQGGTGAPFNLGEITVTRCSVRLACGVDGHAHVQGRNKDHARRAAVLDAMLQTENGAALQDAILVPLALSEAARREARSRRAGATRVEFFTMVRGEDA